MLLVASTDVADAADHPAAVQRHRPGRRRGLVVAAAARRRRVRAARHRLVRERLRPRVDRLRASCSTCAARRPTTCCGCRRRSTTRARPGYLLSKVTYDAQQVASAASEAVTNAHPGALTISFMLAYLLYMNWQLTLIAFAAFPLVGVTIRQDQPAAEAGERAGAGAHGRRSPTRWRRPSARTAWSRSSAASATRATGCARPPTSSGSRPPSRRRRRRWARRSTSSSSPSPSARSSGWRSGRAPAAATAPATSSPTSSRCCSS